MLGCEKGEGGSEIGSISWIISSLKIAFHDSEYEKAEQMLNLREEKLISANNGLKIELKTKMEELIEVRKNLEKAVDELEIFRIKCSQLTDELAKKNKEYYAIFMERRELEFQNALVLKEVSVYERRCNTLKEQITRLEKEKEVISERKSEAGERIAALTEELKRIETHEKERYEELERENQELALAKSRGEKVAWEWKKRCKEMAAQNSQLGKEYLVINQMEKELVGIPEVEPESFHNENFHVEGAERHGSKMSQTKSGANDGNNVFLSSSTSTEKSCGNEQSPNSASAVNTSAKRKDCSDAAVWPSSTKSCNPLLCVKEDERCVSSTLVPELECSNKKSCTTKMDIEKPAIRDTIDICDSDNEAEISPTHTSKYGGVSNVPFTSLQNAVKVGVDGGGETISQKRVTANLSIDFPLAKRCRSIDTSKTAFNNEQTPVGTHKKKLYVLADGINDPMDSQAHNSSIAPTTPLDENAKKSRKLGQPLNPLIYCEEKGDAWVGSSAIRQKMIKQKRLRWQYESDMLQSLEEDPDLCVLAVCALHRQRRFSSFDVQRGSMLADFLLGGTGNKVGGLKKSMKDLELHDPKGLEQCKDLAVRHYTQLFSIYKNMEDPFFL